MSDRFHVFKQRKTSRRHRLFSPGFVTILLNARVAAASTARTSSINSTLINGKIGCSAENRAIFTATGILSGRAAGMIRARVPGGIVLKSIVAAMAKVRASPGYLLFAKATMASAGRSDIHIEGTIIGDHRDPLLLNSGSQYGASYWKGRG